MKNNPHRSSGKSHSENQGASESEGVSLFKGYLEPRSGCTDIVAALHGAINSPTDALPQKYLYASLHGGELWKELCTRRHIAGSPNHIYEVYADFPLEWGNRSLTPTFTDIGNMVFSNVEAGGFIALGAGTGSREAAICDWFCRQHHLKHLHAILVDISSELLGESLQRFSSCVPAVSRRFAVLDFEQPQGEEQLAHLRDKLGDVPVVFAFLGNTFGNLDQRAFLGLMSRLLRPKDVMLCELLIVADSRTRTPDQSDDERTVEDTSFDAHKDVRSQFIIDPLRTLGFNPRLDGLKRRLTFTPAKGLRQTYRYVFNRPDAELAKSLSIEPRPNIRGGLFVDLLHIQALTEEFCRELFQEVFPPEGIRLATHTYQTDKGPVAMGYCFAAYRSLLMHQSRIAKKAAPHDAAMPLEIRLIIQKRKREMAVAGETIRLAPSYYAFIAVLAELFSADSAEPKALAVQAAVAVKLKELRSIQPDWFDERSQKFIDNASSAQDADPISHLKSDLKKALAGEKDRTKAAAGLLEWLPGDREWNFKLHKAEIRFED